MRTLLLLAALCAASSAYAGDPTPPSDRLAESRELAKQLATELKAALSTAMQQSPESAIPVCSERAPQIARSIAQNSDVQIGRTSLRVRNPANEPSEWQQAVLRDFERRLAKGEAISAMEYSTSIAGKDHTEHRYMKAIPVKPLCVTCHGTQIAPPLRQAIQARYPDDQATGYSPGELRGAVVVVSRTAHTSE